MSPFPRDLSGTLVFQSDVRTASNPNGRVKIYTIDLATGRISTLTRDGDWNDEQPRWSPDGQRIAFTSNRSGSYNLYVMEADGRNVRRLTNHAGNDHDPSWLPDGESFVFASNRDRGGGRYDLYRYWLADGSVERLTTFFDGYAFMPNVSPDGNWVAFVATTFPYDGRLGQSGARARVGDEADMAVRRHGAGLLAELVARRPVDRARVAPQRRAVDDPEDLVVRH